MALLTHKRTRTRGVLLLAVIALFVLTSIAARPAQSASSSVVVTMDVASATTLITTGCQDAGTPGRLTLGTVLPGTAARTSVCTITFGSSNDTSALRLHQQDGNGAAMWSYGDGALATTWATGGVHAPVAAGAQHVIDAAVAPDGDTIIAGRQTASWSPFLQRVDASGSFDTAFDGAVGPADGDNGNVFYDGWGPSFSAVAMQGNDIVVTSASNTTPEAYVMRMNADGDIDTSFGVAGETVIPVAGLDESLQAVEVQSDGKILVAGAARTVGEDHVHWSGQLMLARLEADGDLDPTFGTGGVVVDDVTASSDLGSDIVVAADGSIYVSMFAGLACSAQSQRIARFSSTGVRDTAGWGSPNGWVCGVAGGTRLAIAHDGGLLAASNDERTNKYLSTGALDPSFGVAGQAAPGYWTTSLGIYVDAEGRILRVGHSGGGTPASQVIRLLPDGDVDTSFGSGGVVDVQATGGGAEEALVAIVPGVDGRLAAVGSFDPWGPGEAHTIMLERNGILSDYGAVNWTPSATTSAFGVCMQTATSAATTWTTNATCPQTNGAYWRAVPATWGDPTAPVATTASSVANATVALRFGSRAGDNLPPGSYVAPVVFSLVAPAA